MAILKQIKFGNDVHQIAKTQVAVDSSNGSSALSVSSAHTSESDANDPVYTLSLALDGKTIVTNNSNQLETALALKVLSGSGEGASATKDRISLVDSKGGDGYTELSSINIEDIVGEGIVDSATYNASTGILTITWVGDGTNTTAIDLGALLDIQDIVIKSDSTDFLSFAAIDPGTETGGQAQIGVKLADVTYTATSGDTAANLTADTTNGKMLDASDAIPAIKGYVDDKLQNASANLAVTAEGDDYVSASVDAATDNKHVIVETNVQDLTASAGTVGTWTVTDAGDGTAATKALSGDTAASISGVADSLADSSDIATKVATYVGGVVAAEAARADAEVSRAIKSLDVADSAQAGQYVSQVVETDGKIAVTRTDVSGAVLNNYSKGSDATAVASTDTLNQAISKLENQVDAAKAASATVVAEGTDAGNNMSIATTTDSTDGHKTYTINLTDVASAQGLADEITRAQSAETGIDAAVGLTKAANAETRSITPTTNYGTVSGTAATTVMGNMQNIDTALKNLSDTVGAIQYSVSGTTLEFFGMTQHSNS
jgi:hypothetical protein